MAILFDCLHILGILFSMKHVLSIVCNHWCALGARFFSCSNSMPSMHAALLFLSAAIPFLYSSSLNADTNDGFPSTVGSAGHLGFVGIVPWPLTSRWWATWLGLTRHGGFGEVGSLDSFLIICHALRLLWVRSIDVMTSSSFLLSLCQSTFPVSRVPSAKGLLEYCFLYASYRLCNSSVRPGM